MLSEVGKNNNEAGGCCCQGTTRLALQASTGSGWGERGGVVVLKEVEDKNDRGGLSFPRMLFSAAYVQAPKPSQEPRKAKASQAEQSKTEAKPSRRCLAGGEGREGDEEQQQRGGVVSLFGGRGEGKNNDSGWGRVLSLFAQQLGGGCTVVVGRGGTTTPPTPTLL